MSYQLCHTKYVTQTMLHQLCQTISVRWSPFTISHPHHLCPYQPCLYHFVSINSSARQVSIYIMHHHHQSFLTTWLTTHHLRINLSSSTHLDHIIIYASTSHHLLILTTWLDHSSSTHQPVIIYSSYPIITNITEIHSLIITISAIYTMGAINTVNNRGEYIYACTALQLIWRVPPLYLLNLI